MQYDSMCISWQRETMESLPSGLRHWRAYPADCDNGELTQRTVTMETFQCDCREVDMECGTQLQQR